MTIEIKVPVLPESVADAIIAAWHKQVGEAVSRDDNLVDLETDKVVLEVPAPEDGVITEILCQEGDTVLAEQVIARFEPGQAASTSSPAANVATSTTQSTAATDDLTPAVRRLVQEQGIDVSQIKGTGKGGRITKADVEAFAAAGSQTATTAKAAAPVSVNLDGRPEERVTMTRLRARIAERLVDAQQSAAMLTTFNEIDMSAVMQLRKDYKDSFEKQHGVRLGFMSFFTKAAVAALQKFPSVNASIDGSDIVYHGFFDIGMAVSTERGLVVPIVRNADQLSMADIEKQVGEFAGKARDNKLSMEEMTGGTFTITNGGVFGSLLSTPILNPPQSAILGLHKIEQRPIVDANGQIVARPMMYVALSYDHRIIDGKESVQFLRTIKEMIEDPSRLILQV